MSSNKYKYKYTLYKHPSLAFECSYHGQTLYICITIVTKLCEDLAKSNHTKQEIYVFIEWISKRNMKKSKHTLATETCMVMILYWSPYI